MAGGGNPVETGLVESLAKPGGNITGLATIQNELTGKRLELLKEAVPKISRVAMVFNPEGQVPTQGYEPLKAIAQSLKISVEPLEIRKPNEIDKTFAVIPKSSQEPCGCSSLGIGSCFQHKSTKSHRPCSEE
jgi:ABC-type uncharacterized transport system substrate-binding protein